MSEHGRVLAVNRVRMGSELIGDHAAAETVLLVDDGADFDERGGWLQVGDQVVRYSSADHNDDDSADLVLADPLEAAADDGDAVLLWDNSRDVVASEVYAEVELDGETGGDTIKALVAHHLIDELPEGIRGLVGESVLMDEDGDDWRVIDVLGLSEQSGPKWERREPHHQPTAGEITAGTFTRQLLHSRIVGTDEFAVTVNGVDLGFEHVDLDAEAGVATVAIPDWCTTEDHFMFPPYAYLSGPVSEQTGPQVVTPLFVGGATATTGSGGGAVSSLALHGSTQVGDLLVLVTTSNSIGDPVECLDSRLTEVANIPFFSRPSKVWMGYASNLSAVDLNVTGAFVLVSLVSFRGGDGLPLTYDPSLIEVTSPESNSTTDLLPALASTDISGGLCVFVTRGTDSSPSQDWYKAPAYDFWYHVDNSSRTVDMATTTEVPVPAQTTPFIFNGSNYWRAVVIGLELAP